MICIGVLDSSPDILIRGGLKRISVAHTQRCKVKVPMVPMDSSRPPVAQGAAGLNNAIFLHFLPPLILPQVSDHLHSVKQHARTSVSEPEACIMSYQCLCLVDPLLRSMSFYEHNKHERDLCKPRRSQATILRAPTQRMSSRM